MTARNLSPRLEDVGIEAARVRAKKKVHRAAPGQMSGCGMALSTLWDNSTHAADNVTCKRRGCRRTDKDREDFMARLSIQNGPGRKFVLAVGIEPRPLGSLYARQDWRKAVDAKMNKSRTL